MSDEGHVPGQVETEFPDNKEEDKGEPKTPAPEEEKGDEPEGEQPEGEKPKEEEKPEAKKPEEEAPPEQSKKRSIYDDLKEKKHEAKTATARAEAAEAEVARLRALSEKQDQAATPKEKSEAKDDLEAWAEEEGLNPEQTKRFADIIIKRLPASGLSEEDKATLAVVKDFQSQQKRNEEDNEVRAQATQVREQLDGFGVKVHDEAEFKAVMDEIVKLSHTPDFHDKEIGYIVWKNRDAFSKMITPKKKSFEQGGQAEHQGGGEVDFSGDHVSPVMAQSAIESRGRSSGYEIRQGGK